MCLVDNSSGVCIYIYTCRLGEEYVCGCPGRLARGMFSAGVMCVMDFLVLFKSSLFIIIISLISLQSCFTFYFFYIFFINKP